MSNGQGSRSYVCLWTPFVLSIPGTNKGLLNDTYPGLAPFSVFPARGPALGEGPQEEPRVPE